MSVRISFDLGSRPTPALVESYLQLLTARNREILRLHPLPSLYTSGIRYARESRGHEDWQTIDQVYRTKRADCEDLAAALAALLQVAGERHARAVAYAPRPGLIHCVVRRADGRIEDPSRRLGMGGKG